MAKVRKQLTFIQEAPTELKAIIIIAFSYNCMSVKLGVTRV